MYISSTIALSVNPTNRYYKEMGRLLQHSKNTNKNSHNKLHVVASPETERALSISETSDLTWDDDDIDDDYNIPNNNSREKEMMEEAWREQQYHQQQQGEPSLYYEQSSSYHEPTFNDFEEQPATTTNYANHNNMNFEMPRPPSDLPPPPPLQVPEIYNKQPPLSHTTTPLELNSNIPISNGQPINESHNQHQQPKSDSSAIYSSI